MFIKMVILGLKCNPKLPGVGDEIEKIYNETFDKKLNSEDILND